MTEPTSSSVVLTAAAGVGLSTLLPHLDGNALFGAVIGAALIALKPSDLKSWQRLLGLLVSVGVGYISAEEIVAQTPITQSGPGAFVGAIVVVPIALKVLALIEHLELADLQLLLPGWLRKGKGD
ncbi:phage holin family protein [Pseudomonas sp. 5P_3.1_Bac2]|uniref:phage holin family protein n=1 Tax=Pseudomonas sp. 5P_3.1_Bac2 TaxID=2971617 RepID=UPI0021C6C3EC|nr:phage holin family protein [Pseudomonas sp. 5P_3.1_Bac2]MCU1717420.1 phage holin family protein [Pseudomonas sp. 5P_3.1_Bac2]